MYAAIAVTGVCALVYGAVQQNYRQTANDPQIQMAGGRPRYKLWEARARALPCLRTAVDIGNSLAPWVAVYNGYGGIIGSNGALDGAAPSLPQGVFDTHARAR